jgi:hypothetical protein
MWVGQAAGVGRRVPDEGEPVVVPEVEQVAMLDPLLTLKRWCPQGP